MENNTKELSFADLFGIIFKHKILLTVITLMITIVGTLCLEIFYNNSQSYYTTSFTLNYPGIENLTLPDGSNLKYADFISQSSLEKVKESKEDYKNIDVKSITLENDISIAWEIVSNSANKKDTVYTIKVKAKYFNGKKLAKEFLKDLAMLPINNIKEMVSSANHESYLAAYEQTKSFDNKISFLEAQKEYLLGTYLSTIESLGNISINNKSLTIYKQGVENYFLINSLELLKSELDSNGFAPTDEALASSYTAEINALEIKRSTNEKVIEAIRTEIGKTEYDGKQIEFTKLIELIEENAVITEQIAVLTKKLEYASGKIENVTSVTQFEAKLVSFHDEIEKFTDEYISNINAIYEQLSSTSFEHSSIIKETGSIGFALSGIISFILGFIIASATAIIVDVTKKKKANN